MFLSAVRATNKPAENYNTALLLGIEQEYDLFSGGRQLDFRTIFSRVIAQTHSIPFRYCDNAAILDAGYVIASDGQEAELATVAISSRNDGCLRLAHEVSRCRRHMLLLLEKVGVGEVRGYSTHLNISVPIGRELEMASALSKTVAPALILLMESRQSPGMLIRPRRGRLEIGSEYIDDEKQLTAAAVFLTGVVHIYLHNELVWNLFPQLRLIHAEEANIRPGIYLPRNAFGDSLHDLGRTALVELESGEQITAGEILKRSVDLVLTELNGQINEHIRNTLREFAQQEGLLPIEEGSPSGIISKPIPHSPASEAKNLKMLVSAPDKLGVMPRFVDWEGVAFSWSKANDPPIVGVPWAHLPLFFEAARNNDITRVIPGQKPVGQVLNSLDQLQSPQAYKEVDPVALGTQALNDKGKHRGSKGGQSKPQQQLEPINLAQTLISRQPMPLPIKAGTPRWIIGLIIGLIIILTLACGVLALKFISERHSTPRSTPTSVRLSTSASNPTSSRQHTSQSTPTSVIVPRHPQNHSSPTPVCSPAPIRSYPLDGAELTTNSLTFSWSSDFALGSGQVYGVFVSPHLNDLAGKSSSAFLLGTSKDKNLTVDLLTWKYAGKLGKYYWEVHIQGADGQIINCPGMSPGSFTLNPLPANTQKPKPQPKPQPPILSPPGGGFAPN